MFDAGEVLCPLLALGVVALLIWGVVSNAASKREALRRELLAALHALTERVEALERRSEASGRGAPAKESGAAPAPSPAPPTSEPSSGVTTQPPPLPAPVGLLVPPASIAPPVARVSRPASAAPLQTPASSPPAAAPARPQAGSLESFLGGRVLLVAGVVVVLFGIAFFLKYAIGRGWIGPSARIAMGVTAGSALLAGGDRLRRRGFDVFGQALMGCGLGALYLSNWFACKRYEFIGTTTAFALTATLAAAGATLALWRRAPMLASLGFLGGYLAPYLLGDPRGTLPALTGWLLVLDAGVLAVMLRRTGQGLDAMAFLFTVVYVGKWGDTSGVDSPANRACIGALLAASLALGLVPPLVRRAAPSPLSLLVVAAAAALGMLAWHALLAPHAVVASGALALGVAVAFAAAGLAFERRVPAASSTSASLYGLAAAALVTAVAEWASGQVVAPALSVVGVAVVFAGVRLRQPVLVAAGLASIGLAFGDLLTERLTLFEERLPPLFNRRFLLFETPCAALVVASLALRRAHGRFGALPTLVAAAGLWMFAVVLAASLHADLRHAGTPVPLREAVPVFAATAYGLAVALLFGRGAALGRVLALGPLAFAFLTAAILLAFERSAPVPAPIANVAFAAAAAPCVAAFVAARQPEAVIRGALRIAALVWLFCVVTADLSAWGEGGTVTGLTREEVRFRAQVGISVAWALYAAALVAAGFWRREPVLRWMGLGLFALTLGKVFLSDMARLEAVYRIGSFLVLGVLLVGASFLYQRARRSEPPPT